MLLEMFNITALGEVRESEGGRERLRGLNQTRLTLCELLRQEAFVES